MTMMCSDKPKNHKRGTVEIEAIKNVLLIPGNKALFFREEPKKVIDNLV